ncbi:hypothetical protein [Ideonella sp.]|uniref:hypothetical protein n=1 Tax=Ideonella sp. TaxID=1929293 RepID=UPI003BB67A99
MKPHAPARRSGLITLAALSLVAALTACATGPGASVTLTYETVPEGAVLFEGKRELGVAPVTQSYPSDGKSAEVTTPEVTAVWPSGAKTSFYTVLKPGADRVATLERPANAPNAQADLENAKKFVLAKTQEAQREKDAAAREIARNSARCRQQLATGNMATNDCQ